MHRSRRDLLRNALALPLARRLDAQTPPPVDAQFHLHPHYRSATPLDAAILKVQAGSDEFVNEKYHDSIARVLGTWSRDLLQSPGKTDAIENSLALGFQGCAMTPTESRIVRAGPALEVRHISFAGTLALEGKVFLQTFRGALHEFSKIATADFQVTRMDGLRTRVRYEMVGPGQSFHRQQRVGTWDLEWELVSPGEYRVRRWQANDETRSRSGSLWFTDLGEHAFGRNSSWPGQMLHGVDYWRTVLDGASGIDIYGHNGVSAGDIDDDGFDDVYVCQPAGLPNRLYRNRGDGTFEDITESSGVGLLDNTACAIFADFDNDGRQDLVVVRASGPLLFLNQGGGKFLERPDAFKFAKPPQGTFTGAAAADYDRDGWLDIYFCLYTYYQGTDQYKYPIPYYAAENGPPNFMMKNNRDRTFRDVTGESGLSQNNTRYSFCCGWGDSNGDGWPDLYVVNDFGRKNLYRNKGDGTFTDVAAQTGVEDVGAGMGVCWFDYNNDGQGDLYVANMWTAAGERISTQENFKKNTLQTVRAEYQKHAMGNSLFQNRGDGTFLDATDFNGGGMGRWAWSTDAWDFDHDGFPDLYVANGMISGVVRQDLNSFFWRQVVANSPDEVKQAPEYEQGWNAVNELIRADYTWSGYERNVFYANNGDGTFADVSGAVGLDFVEDSRAFALADFDHDGRLEVLLKNRNAPQLRLLKNVADPLPPSIAFRLRGDKSNRDAIGAAITLESESARQTRWLQAGSGFLSQHSKEVIFGLGKVQGPVNASIRWPSGLVQQLHALPVNHRIWVEEGREPARMERFKNASMVTIAKTPPGETLPAKVETWLLAPLPAPEFEALSKLRGKTVLLNFQAPGSPRIAWDARSVQPLTVTIDGRRESDDVAAVYNLLYRYLFDRRRDLALPASFLINERGEIVKVYQGLVNSGQVVKDAQAPQSGLPFRGNSDHYAIGRNHLSLGSVFFQRGYIDHAEGFFALALRDDPSSAEARYGLGSVYLKQGRSTEARASFEQTTKLNASYPDTIPNAWNNLGLLDTREGRTDEAIACFQEALRQSPGYWIALQNLGNAYRQQKRWDDAREVLQRSVVARPMDPEANYSLAMVFAQTDDTIRAYQYLQKALQLRPGYPEALNNLGVLYLRTGKRDEAVAKFEECIRVAPGFDQSYLNLARVYSVEGNPDKARAVLNDLLKQHPDHLQARKALDQIQ